MTASTFGIFPTEVARNPSLSFAAKAVYANLCTYRNADTGICWPKRETLANDMGCSIRSVSYALAELGEAGLISRTGDGGCNRSAETLMPWPGVEINPAISCTPPLQPFAGASNRPFGTEKTTPTPSPVADHQGEGDFVFQGKEPVFVDRPWEITPPLYEVTEQEVDVETITLADLPPEILALDRPEQINPATMLPILIALIGLSPPIAQALLDELSGRLACQSLKAIDSPISYFRYLVREVRAGRFEVRYGADIAAARRAREAHQARLEGSSPPPPTITPDRQPESKMSADELRAMMRQALRGGAA